MASQPAPISGAGSIVRPAAGMTNQVTEQGLWLHDKDGMTNMRAELLVAQKRHMTKEMADAALVGNRERVAECQRTIDAIEKEARYLNRVRRQRIEGIGRLAFPFVSVKG